MSSPSRLKILHTIAQLLKQRERQQRRRRVAETARQRVALDFGPAQEPWHFMPSHLRLSELAEEAASYRNEATHYLRHMPPWLISAQLDLDIWRDIYLAQFAEGDVVPAHGHTNAGAIYVHSGSLRVTNLKTAQCLGSQGIQELGAGDITTFGLSGQHRIEVLARTVVVEVFSPRLVGEACHHHVRQRTTASNVGQHWLAGRRKETATQARVGLITRRLTHQAGAATATTQPAHHSR